MARKGIRKINDKEYQYGGSSLYRRKREAMEMTWRRTMEKATMEMAAIEKRVGENAKALGISEREALVQGLVSAAWWADVRGDWRGYEIYMAAARHAAGQISDDEYRERLEKFKTLERLGY